MGLIDDVHDSEVDKVAKKTHQNWSDVSEELKSNPEAFAYKYKKHLTDDEFANLGGSPV